MYTLSNADVREVQRLLLELRHLTGTDTHTLNVQRRASRLRRRLEQKQPNNSTK